MALEINGIVEKGHLPEYQRKQIAEALKKLEGKRVLVKIDPYKRKRTSPENRFYFGVIIPIIRQAFFDQGTVMSALDIHDYLWGNVLKEVEPVTLPDGDIYWRRKSSTKFTTTEWEIRMDILRSWAAESGIQLPFPNEVI